MKQIILSIIILISSNLKATDLLEFIPSDAVSVFSLNFEQLNKKSKGLDYLKYLEPFMGNQKRYYYGYDESRECDLIDISKLVKDPVKYGIDIKSNAYVYYRIKNKYAGKVYLFKLSNVKKFESLIGEVEMPKEELENTEEYSYYNKPCNKKPLSSVKYYEGGSMHMSEKIVVGISGDMAFIFVNDRNQFDIEETQDYSYDYYGGNRQSYMDSIYYLEVDEYRKTSDSLLYIRLNKNKNLDYSEELSKFEEVDSNILNRAKERERVRKQKELDEKFEILSLEFSNLLKKQKEHIGMNRNFTQLKHAENDVVFFFNTPVDYLSNLMSPFSRRYSYDKEQINTEKRTLVYTANVSGSYILNFDNGKARIKMLSTYGKEAYEFYKKAYDIKQNKNLFKYIEGNNLMAYISTATKTKELSKFYEAFYFELLGNSNMRKSEQDIVPAVELFWSFIDKEMLYNTCTNQMLFAFNGFIETKIKYKSYDYDDDFKRIETMEEKIVKQPKMVLAMNIDNKENAAKLFEIISKFSFTEKIKSNVLAFQSYREFKTNIYLCMTEDAFIITNDYNLVMNQQSGIPADKQISKTEQAYIMEHNFTMKVFSSQMLNGINSNFPSTSKEMKKMSEMAASLGDMYCHDNKPTADGYEFEAVLTLKDNAENSLYTLLKMMSANDR